MKLNEFFDYKNLLMKDICSSAEIVHLLTNNDEASVPNLALRYTQVFPYEFVPDTVSEAKTFVCFDVDILEVKSRTLYTPVIYVWVFTHKSKMRTEDGRIVVDELACEIDNILNGDRRYGLGELALKTVRRFVPIDDYYGRALVYQASDFNRQSGSKPRPANRKQGA